MELFLLISLSHWLHIIDLKDPKEIDEFFIRVTFSRKIIKIEIVESVKDEKYQSVNGRNRHVMLIFRKLEMRQRFPRVTYFFLPSLFRTCSQSSMGYPASLVDPFSSAVRNILQYNFGTRF